MGKLAESHEVAPTPTAFLLPFGHSVSLEMMMQWDTGCLVYHAGRDPDNLLMDWAIILNQVFVAYDA